MQPRKWEHRWDSQKYFSLSLSRSLTHRRDMRTIQMNCNISEFIRFNTLMPTFWNMYGAFYKSVNLCWFRSFFCVRALLWCDFFSCCNSICEYRCDFLACGPQDPLQSSVTKAVAAAAAAVASIHRKVDFRINYTRALYQMWEVQCNDRHPKQKMKFL